MKRRITFYIATSAVLLGITVAAASAQTASRASVPFAFSANRQLLPAGNYQIALHSGSFLSLTNRDTGKVVELLSRKSDAHQEIAQGSLVFHLVGGRYRLTQVRFAHANVESDLAVQQSKLERELEANALSATIELGSR